MHIQAVKVVFGINPLIDMTFIIYNLNFVELLIDFIAHFGLIEMLRPDLDVFEDIKQTRN